MKKSFKKNKDYLIVFIVTLLFLLTIFLVTGYFNSNTLLYGDMKAQYLPLFSKLKEILTGNNSVLYSLNKGIGGNFIGTFFYYLSSPLNLFVIFFKTSTFYIFFLFLFSIKIILSSITMYMYLKKHFSNFLFSMMFSLLYAFSSYMMGYFVNIMWLDALYFLPILVLSIEKFIEKGKVFPYVIILFLSIFSNYYIGYMLCIFSVIYFFYYSYIHEKQFFKRKCIQFFVVSFFTGLSCSFFLIPSLIDFINSTHISSLTDDSVLKINNLNFIGYFFLNGNKKFNILNPNFYYLYASILIFPLIILYFFHKNISKREKKATFFVFLLFMISIFFPFFDKIWHLFSNPLYYTGRYSFIFIFFSILISYRSLLQIPYLEKKYYFYISILFPIGGIILYILKTTSIIMIIINCCLYFLYLILFNFIKLDKKVSYFLVLISLSELFFFTTNQLENYGMISSSKKEVVGYYEDLQKEISFIKKYDNSSFYRVHDSHMYTSNPGQYLNYNGINVFYSTVDTLTMNFFRKFSYESRLNDVNYNPNNEIINSILGIKYLIIEGNKVNDMINSNDKMYNGPVLYEHNMKTGNSYMYGLFESTSYILENESVLPLGFMISSKNNKIEEKNDIYNYSNTLFNNMLGKNINVYEQIMFEKIDNFSYKVVIPKEKKLVAYIKNNKDPLSLYLNNELWKSYENKEKIEIEFPSKEEYIFSSSKENLDINFYYYDEELFEKYISTLKENSFIIEQMKDTYIKGNVISNKEKSTLFLSIPYDKGWNIYVDGKKVKKISLYATFLGVHLEEGSHIIELKYTPQGLKLGLIISIFSFLMQILLYKLIWKKYNLKNG